MDGGSVSQRCGVVSYGGKFSPCLARNSLDQKDHGTIPVELCRLWILSHILGPMKIIREAEESFNSSYVVIL